MDKDIVLYTEKSRSYRYTVAVAPDDPVFVLEANCGLGGVQCVRFLGFLFLFSFNEFCE